MSVSACCFCVGSVSSVVIAACVCEVFEFEFVMFLMVLYSLEVLDL